MGVLLLEESFAVTYHNSRLRFPFVDPGALAEEVLWIQKRHLSSAMQWLWIIFLQ